MSEDRVELSDAARCAIIERLNNLYRAPSREAVNLREVLSALLCNSQDS